MFQVSLCPVDDCPEISKYFSVEGILYWSNTCDMITIMFPCTHYVQSRFIKPFTNLLFVGLFYCFASLLFHSWFLKCSVNCRVGGVTLSSFRWSLVFLWWLSWLTSWFPCLSSPVQATQMIRMEITRPILRPRTTKDPQRTCITTTWRQRQKRQRLWDTVTVATICLWFCRVCRWRICCFFCFVLLARYLSVLWIFCEITSTRLQLVRHKIFLSSGPSTFL